MNSYKTLTTRERVLRQREAEKRIAIARLERTVQETLDKMTSASQPQPIQLGFGF